MNVRPKKSLGQHFLTDPDIARRIADTLDADPRYATLPTIEVGPGTGVLTQYLLQRPATLRVVELDTESVAYLHAAYPTLDIVDADFLRLSDQDLFPGDAPFNVIGNYPYNISSQIFFKVLDWKERVRVCSGMLQKEVAERLAAREGTRARGILSVLLQAWYEVEYLFTVPPGVFNPPPKVYSGVVRLTRRDDVHTLGCDETRFKTVVKTAFAQRRKTLRNALRAIIPPDSPLHNDPILTLRPEQLSVDDFIRLTNAIYPLKE